MTSVKLGQVTFNSVTLNIAIEGPDDAQPLLLAHPLGANLQVWDTLAPRLATKFRVIRFDARGHGRSSAPAGPYTLADLGGDALALMDELQLARADFLGLSMGGAIGQWLTIHAPNRLRKIVLANTASHFPDAAGWNGRIRAARGPGMAALAPAILERWLTENFRAARPDIAARIEAMLRASDPQGYAASCAVLRDTDLRDAIRRAPPCPALVIVGDSDASTPPERGAALAASLPDARLLRLASAHLSCIEAEAAFLAGTMDFLN